jgi:pantoate--beta-alanine ligase
MSSRNQYLSADERQRAGVIHRTLVRMCENVRAGKPHAAIEADALRTLEDEGLAVDYAVVRRREDLSEPLPGERHGLIALIAAKLGRARLIDNLSADL